MFYSRLGTKFFFFTIILQKFIFALREISHENFREILEKKRNNWIFY